MEQRDPGARPSSSAENLPEWASPSQGERSAREQDGGMRTKVGPPCPGSNCSGGNDPTREVPLGGLEWLILAGAGYGLFKLRDEE